ncbi:MAG: four helix bundle protein [Candidatus Kapaibacterium sp.]
MSVTFGALVRRWCHEVPDPKRTDESALRQLYRCGTSVGANIREAQFAESTKDFHHKLKIAEKELGEFYYWLGILHKQPPLAVTSSTIELEGAALQVRKMMRAAIKTTKEKLRKSAPQ